MIWDGLCGTGGAEKIVRDRYLGNGWKGADGMVWMVRNGCKGARGMGRVVWDEYSGVDGMGRVVSDGYNGADGMCVFFVSFALRRHGTV